MEKVVVFIKPIGLTRFHVDSYLKGIESKYELETAKYVKSLGYKVAVAMDKTFYVDNDLIDYVIYTNCNELDVLASDLTLFSKKCKISGVISFT